MEPIDIEDSADDIVIVNANNPNPKKGKNWCLTINSKEHDPDAPFASFEEQIAQFTVLKSSTNYFVYGKEIAPVTSMFFDIL